MPEKRQQSGLSLADEAAAQAALEKADSYARSADAPATLRAYRADWEGFAVWCDRYGFLPVPAEPRVVGAYLASLAETHAPASLRRKLSAIGKMHKFNSLPWNPAHRDIQQPLRGILRRHGRPVRQAAPLTMDLLKQLVATCDSSARGRRDRLLLLLGFAGALRRSELVGLDVNDVARTADGLTVTIRRSKTDAEREGAKVGIPRGRHPQTCPVLAFDAWQAVALRNSGPLFRRISVAGRIASDALQPYAVQRILLHRTSLAGIEMKTLSPHAMRVGFITEAYNRGVRDEDIMKHTRHKDLRTMRGYVRRAGLITDSPAGLVGL
ncbi:tyrosine-type recombinase/integrase [Acetobacter sacchari]|uniref:Tyrosine-type recombinase/integrase n=2 Tax=Acetobacter sacchari TaxID=2661687 RepID=A0ABS3LWK8_9PROT|nr:tyrosine-type recombinase/integrase [Acetobacter sacchari]MBO1360256.1 tyrosine-type recombinase/integrase [Acetobacter sacchari]